MRPDRLGALLTLACGAVFSVAFAAEVGLKERAESGAVVLRAGKRPPISLIYPSKSVIESKLLGVTWDGRVWFSPKCEDDYHLKHFQGSIEVVTPKGSARRLARFARDIVCIGGSLSPDGKYLAFAVHEEKINGTQRREPPILVFIMQSDGKGKRLVAKTSYRGESPAWVYRVSWSPDSARVAIPVREGGRNRIALVSARTGEKTYLPVPDWAEVTCPDWSPDGRSIAYSCEDRRWKPKSGEGTDWASFRWFVWRSSGETEAGAAAEEREYRKLVRPASIWVTDLASGKSRSVTKTPKADVVQLLPAWSPGGTQLAYLQTEWEHEAGDMHYWGHGLRSVRADGSQDHAVKDGSDKSYSGPIGVAEGKMEWLPDGRRIVLVGFQQNAEGRAVGLAMVRADGTQGWPLTPGMGDWLTISLQDAPGYKHKDGLLVESFALSPDGNYAVASGSLWSGAPAGLWRVPIPGSAAAKRG
jgi:WD40 repeat protein